MSPKACILVFPLLLIVAPLHAGGAKRGWTKIELTHTQGDAAPFPADLLARFGAEPIADYGTYAIAYAPEGAIDALSQQAAKQDVRIRVRDDLDLLRLPGATVDVREGIVAAARLARPGDYPPGRPGLFVLQLAAPLRSEWAAELRQLGWTLSRYVPNDGYIVVGPPHLAARTRQLSYVQWLDYFHPYQKAAFLARDGAAHDQLFELPAGEDSASGVEAIRAAAQGDIQVYRGSADTLVYARMTGQAAEQLLQHEMILSVSPRPAGALSDERQVMSLTTNLNAAQSQPTSPGQYWSWILAHCPACSSMPSGTWKVGLADSGMDDGANGFGSHPDLNGRKYYGSAIYTGADDAACAPGQRLCDAYGHGTIVAGIAGGNAATGVLDGLGFSLGEGVAPTAGVFMTKIFSLNSLIDPAHLFQWAGDAVNSGVAIQSHSWNEYGTSPSGLYSTLSRQYDIAARDADDALSPSRLPILFTISAGNNDQGAQDAFRFLTLPGATAKNVLAVGGVENYRTGVTGCHQENGDSFRNVMHTSRIGTRLAGYVKPDVMAPASLIISAKTTVPTPFPYCLNSFEGHSEYTGDTGTSFAAPVGAGASLIVKRYLGNAPDDISPALTKAVLIAGAHSVRGGEDRTHVPSTPIGPVPSQQQGFGRLSFEDILTGAQKPVVFDQSSQLRLFTDVGQVFRARLRAHDAAKPVKVVLVWTDAPATAFVSNPLVNDLNLEVSRSLDPAHVYVGNQLQVANEVNGEESTAFSTATTPPYDNVNNVEYFRLYMGLNDEFEVAVKSWNLAGDTDPAHAGFEQDFALVAVNADLAGGGLPIAPIFSAQTDPSVASSVNLSWTPASNMMVTGYDVYRGTNLSNMQFLLHTTSTTAVDAGRPANTAFVYRVVAPGPGGNAVSNNDVATTIPWLTAVAVGTAVTAQQANELRQGIDYVRIAAQLPTNTWAATITPGTVIRAAHMNEMRDKLEAALTALSAPLPAYHFPDPVATLTPIHADDVNDLRNKVH